MHNQQLRFYPLLLFQLGILRYLFDLVEMLFLKKGFSGTMYNNNLSGAAGTTVGFSTKVPRTHRNLQWWQAL